MNSHLLGLVTGDEKEAGKSPYGTTGRYSEFENGHIHWISDIGDDNAGKIYRGKAFATYGDLDLLYTNDDGTNGKLGFPVMDKYETTAYGHGECVFEGGKIIWDDYRGLHEIIYHGYLPDLTITDISFSKDNPVEGEPITIYATIKNVGYADAFGKFAVTFYQQSYYEDFEIDETGSKAYIGQMVGENLGAGESGLVSMTWNAAPVFSTNPDGFINIEVDSSDEIEETNEYNNVELGEVTVTTSADFRPERDVYHFKNFEPSTDQKIDMITNVKAWFDLSTNPFGLGIDILSLIGGSLCYGMSSTDILYYDERLPKPVDKNVFDMLKTDKDVTSNILRYQAMQFPDVLFNLFIGLQPDYLVNVENEFIKIEDSIKNGEYVVSHIRFYNENGYPLQK